METIVQTVTDYGMYYWGCERGLDAQSAGYEVEFNAEKDTVEGWPGTDSFTAAQSAVLGEDYDAIACSFSGMEIWAQPIADLGKEDAIKLAGVGSLTEASGALLENGQIASLVYECEEIVFGNAIPMIINAVNGHADLVKGDEGYCALGVARWNLKDYSAFTSVYEKHNAGEYYVTAEDMTQFFPEFNESASKETLESFYAGMTLSNAISK